MKTSKLLLGLGFLAMSTAVSAQVDLTNTGTLYLSSGTDVLYVNGIMTNNASGLLTNNGALHLRGNLVNNQATMAVGTGTLFLNGSALQTVSGAQQFRTFNFVSSNAAGILLSNNLSVSGVHTFTDGIISTSATPNYLIYEDGSSYTGDGDSRHVSGWVRKTGATDFVFPVGNGTVERTIAAVNLTALSTYNTNYGGATPNTGNVLAPLFTVDQFEYWNINRVSGGNAQIAMNWDESKITMPNYGIPDIRVAHYTGGMWTSIGGSATGNVNTTGNITSNVTSSFGAFVLGSISFVLPVQLVKFTAVRKNGKNIVSWSTTDEVNVARYEVERSDDGNLFYLAGTAAAQNSGRAEQYEISDAKSMGQVAYYRLRSIDKDNKSRVSSVVKVFERVSLNDYFSVANPMTGAIRFTAGSNHNGNYNYNLVNLAGQTVQKGKVSISNGGTYTVPLTSSVRPGIYVLEVRSGSFVNSQRVLVQ
ncbi:MAG: T9SS type A sorting domain-containing protein [Gemmatimonadaceae bacterium]|nr:T9SS type A sorting domain-containing protein [Chitinophagaceae bacterium]